MCKNSVALAALSHALTVTLRGKARVNSISLGWIDTDYKEYEGADAVQQPAGRLAIHWTLPIWCCFSALTRQDSSQAKTSASTVA